MTRTAQGMPRHPQSEPRGQACPNPLDSSCSPVMMVCPQGNTMRVLQWSGTRMWRGERTANTTIMDESARACLNRTACVSQQSGSSRSSASSTSHIKRGGAGVMRVDAAPSRGRCSVVVSRWPLYRPLICSIRPSMALTWRAMTSSSVVLPRP